jgi:DNA-binding NarL/FixJ family response regulator
MVTHGSTTKEIAAELNVSRKAVDFHRCDIRRKMGLRDRSANLREHLRASLQLEK